MKDVYSIIVAPHITEKTLGLSYGDQRKSDEEIVRTYTFLISPTANKIEVKRAIEAIYNEGKKKEADKIKVTDVRTVRLKGKTRRVGRNVGKRADRRKAVVTLAPGHVLEDYGV